MNNSKNKVNTLKCLTSIYTGFPAFLFIGERWKLWILLCFFVSFSLPSLASNNQQEDSLVCLFYTENDLLFQKSEANVQTVEFYVSGSTIDEKKEYIETLLFRKKGVNTFSINNYGKNKIVIKLNTSPLFDAHYLRIILETQLKFNYVSINDIPSTWEDFEKLFLKNNLNK
ncbi:MAG: hypothetical protein CVU05_11595 [Bacteroidetes bacterium HGW-Bacteroidetes-21]|jgi:hypothetical protein|nr:MAG: hypothetical protein CVU05_11595 [Bacteroidetes bacterium HGW-Bacteroidetes-21]